MAFKFIALFACIAVASAGLLPAAPLTAIAEPVLEKTDSHDPHPQYSFGYDVQDAISGDNKNQVESRDGDIVQGQYSLNDADGYRRIVDYTADPLNGFNAVVRREPLGAVAVKTVAAAPALIKSAPAQFAYAATPSYIKAAPAPLAYAASPAYIKSSPAQLTYTSSPAYIKTSASPIAYTASSALIKSAPVSYGLASGQTLIRTAPAQLAHVGSPALIRTAPTLSYAAPAYLRSQTQIIKSSPVLSYSSAPTHTLVKSYAAAPALAYAANAPTLIKTSYSSPIVSYSY